jgi:2'-5' RNA ligase
VDTCRTFIAIELPRDVRRGIKEHIDQLRAVFPDVRASWTREDNLHLTLKFLGNVPVARIPALSNAVAEAAHEIDPFDLGISSCGTFPPHGRPKVLWIGCPTMEAQASRLHLLHGALEDRCAAAGFEREPRAYHPHLTIARLRESKDSRTLAEHHRRLDFASQSFTVSGLVVFRSELSSKGSKHTALSRHELG